MTPSAEKLLGDGALRLETLRNGDWKTPEDGADPAPFRSAEAASGVNSSLLEERLADPLSASPTVGSNVSEHRTFALRRLEGTPAYSPPEVLRLRVSPGRQADAWALGCVTYFCIHGRPLYYGDTDAVSFTRS